MNDLVIAYLIAQEHYSFTNLHALPTITINDRGTGVDVTWTDGHYSDRENINYGDLLAFMWSEMNKNTTSAQTNTTR